MSEVDLNDVVEALKAIVGERNVVTDKHELQALGCDWTKIFTVAPLAAVLPGNTDEVSKVLKACCSRQIAVVPSGGRTGLAGGAVAGLGTVVLSLNRMNRIESVDKTGLTVRCQAGATTQAVQEAATAAGLFFGLDLAAKGSCQIGGNIATNAGGLKFIRFGGMREQVLGLEVVLADGTVLDMNSSIRKNNTGYDLKQLFIGSEGTLGVVTGATLKLAPKPRNVSLACIGVERFSDITAILKKCYQQGIQITAFEFFTRAAHEIVLQHSRGSKTPFEGTVPFYVLLEIEDAPGGINQMEALLEDLLDKQLCVDAVMAQSHAQFIELWSLRENITESLAVRGHVRKNDISVPVDRLDAFYKDLESVVTAGSGDTRGSDGVDVILFGHVGDGNLHVNYSGSREIDFAVFNAAAKLIERKIFHLLPKYQGSISAEHGIGLLKKEDLKFSRTETEIEIMRSIKKILDPSGIMNPGKIF